MQLGPLSLYCLITINICFAWREGITWGEGWVIGTEKGERLERKQLRMLLPYPVYTRTSQKCSRGTNGQETPVITYTFFNVSEKNERSLEMKKGRKKKSLPFVFLSFEL